VGGSLAFSNQNGHSTIVGERKRRGIDIIYETDHFTSIVNIENFLVKNCSGSGITDAGIPTKKNSIVQGNVSEYFPGGIVNSVKLSPNNTSVRGNELIYNVGGISYRETLEQIINTVKDSQFDPNCSSSIDNLPLPT